MHKLYSFKLPASPSHGQFPLAKFRCKLSPSCQVFFLSPHTPIGCVRLAHFARIRLLCHALLISLLILEKNRLFCSLPKGLESGQISRLLKISPRVNTKLILSFEYLTLSDACLTQYLLFLFVSDLTEEEVLQMAVQLSLQEM